MAAFTGHSCIINPSELAEQQASNPQLTTQSLLSNKRAICLVCIVVCRSATRQNNSSSTKVSQDLIIKHLKMSVIAVLGKFWQEYAKNTPKKLKIIDAYLLYIFLTGVTQFVYCCLVGTFPFNSFLSGFISCVSSFVLGVCLRLQVNPQNKSQFHGISPERGFADFIFAHIILHIVVMNFIG